MLKRRKYIVQLVTEHQKCSAGDGQAKKLPSNLCANDKKQHSFSESAPCTTVTDNSGVIEENAYNDSSNEGPNSTPQPVTDCSVSENELNAYENNSDDDSNWEPSVDDTIHNEEPSGYHDSVEGNSNSTPSVGGDNINENQADTSKEFASCFIKNTLAITDRIIQITIAKIQNGFLSEQRRRKPGKQRKLDPAINESIRKHIKSFLRIESHYLRNQTSRKYIDGRLTIGAMHSLYIEDRNTKNLPSGNVTMYERTFNDEYNIGFFLPKKDQCTFCESFNNADTQQKVLMQVEKDKHEAEKRLKIRNSPNKNYLRLPTPIYKSFCPLHVVKGRIFTIRVN
ncbi:hypothetical protein ILUMI_11312 [Ignelater luminosus]|uniref:Uncharacterized protein n=1 Tax=Ignelater luminosus TaxID=2038154 RepID=A0A8K0D599_IGNLU|nr:hypothetical protein ILUMI_11312 [Ignelater luminosus]